MNSVKVYKKFDRPNFGLYLFSIGDSSLKLLNDQGIWYINNIDVTESMRLTGIGQKLVNEAIQFAKSRGVKKLRLFAIQEEASGFWAKMGFDFDTNSRLI